MWVSGLLPAGGTRGRFGLGGGTESQVPILPHPVVVAADIHDVTVAQKALDQVGGHGTVAEDFHSFLEAIRDG